ncbi:PepSY domain-containing protein [Paenalcaligenes sp. Me131]|uniref:PepSY domain-containing protein n=1 Tax=Paenalcaligenes sp. Me131 TaxID=3392636 RepID=UPI003D2A6156
MKTRHAVITSVLCSALLLGGVAQAQTTAPVTAPQATTQQQTALTIRDVYDLLEKQGYQNIREIERERRHFDVKADDAQGQRMKLRMDLHTGDIVRSRFDD